MSDRFDFEQQILKCWNIIDDLKEANEELGSEQIGAIATLYEVKFNKLWEQFEDVVMNLVRENKMLNEECAAMREQLQFAYDGQGYRDDHDRPQIQSSPVPPDSFTREEARMAVMKAKKNAKR
jgi:hypothetical protein